MSPLRSAFGSVRGGNQRRRSGRYTLSPTNDLMKEQSFPLCAFQEKSKRGIKTPKPEIDKIQGRIKQIKELVKNER